MLVVDDIAISFDGGPPVFDGVDLRIGRGEIVALLGASGSGKSTLLRIVAGLEIPDRGRVAIDGRDVTAVPTHRRSVGMVFQDEQLFPHLSVRDNVAFGMRMAGLARPDRHRRAAELLDRVGLSAFGDRGVRELSGGEAKRVAVARSLAPSPKVLLLDEPLTGLDRDLHDQLVTELATILRGAETTAVWVTHDHAEADAIADRVARMDELAR